MTPAATLLSLDLLGFGGSPKPAGRYGFERHLDALEGALERQRIAGPLTLVGRSFGALLALAAAARWGRRVRGVKRPGNCGGSVAWKGWSDGSHARLTEAVPA